MDLTIVTTLYRSAATVEEFYRRMTAAAATRTQSYELIFVDDGSPDDARAVAVKLCQHDPAVSVVELSRNFGHHTAIMAGLEQAQGDRVFLIDVDLEDQPEWLAQFWDTLNASDVDVVYGVQAKRSGGWFRRFSGQLFYRLFNALSDVKIVENALTVRLMRREYVDALLRLRDKNIFLAGNLAWVGFRQQPITLDRQIRSTPSSYSLVRRLTLFTTAITSFTSYPLQIVSFVGLLISVLAGLGGLVVLVNKILHPEVILLGYASLIVSIWFLSGLIILFVGVVGIYLARIFAEVKDRPRFVVRRVYHQSLLSNSQPAPRPAIQPEPR